MPTTKGCNDTQVVEATFSDIKCLSKSEFGNKIPTLSELIIILPKIQQIYSSRLAGDLPQISKIVLEKASWILNVACMRLFHEAITMSDNKRDDMKIEDCEDSGEIVVENYRGRNSAGYVGRKMCRQSRNGNSFRRAIRSKQENPQKC